MVCAERVCNRRRKGPAEGGGCAGLRQAQAHFAAVGRVLAKRARLWSRHLLPPAASAAPQPGDVLRPAGGGGEERKPVGEGGEDWDDDRGRAGGRCPPPSGVVFFFRCCSLWEPILPFLFASLLFASLP